MQGFFGQGSYPRRHKALNIWGVRNLRNTTTAHITEMVFSLSKISSIEMLRCLNSGKSWKITQLPTKTLRDHPMGLKGMAVWLWMRLISEVQKDWHQKAFSQKKREKTLISTIGTFCCIIFVYSTPTQLNLFQFQPCSASSV